MFLILHPFRRNVNELAFFSPRSRHYVQEHTKDAFETRLELAPALSDHHISQ
jgi:hypothetical protein